MNTTTSTEYDVQVGRVLGAHGLRGLVRVLPLTDVPDRHRTLKEVMVRVGAPVPGARVSGARAPGTGAPTRPTTPTRPSAPRLMTIERAVPSGKGLWLVKFEGIEDRTAAEKLRGAELFIRDDELPPLPEGQYYIHQIIGLQVRTVDGRDLGPVTEVLQTGANDVYETAAGLLPATPEVIREIDLEAGTMLVEPLPGMLEE